MESFPSGRGHSWILKGQWTVFVPSTSWRSPGEPQSGKRVTDQVGPGRNKLQRSNREGPMLALGRATDQWSWLRIKEH